MLQKDQVIFMLEYHSKNIEKKKCNNQFMKFYEKMWSSQGKIAMIKLLSIR